MDSKIIVAFIIVATMLVWRFIKIFSLIRKYES
jgi:hypothetical protein